MVERILQESPRSEREIELMAISTFHQGCHYGYKLSFPLIILHCLSILPSILNPIKERKTSQSLGQNGTADLAAFSGNIAVGETFGDSRFGEYWLIQFADGFRMALLLTLRVISKCI